MPFGQEWNPQITQNHYKFTGDEHDSESNLQHTEFRQLSSTQGRWTSPDPLAGDIGDPQSLNRYAYVGNNPMNATDPLGLLCNPLNPFSGCAGLPGFFYGSVQGLVCFFSNCGDSGTPRDNISKGGGKGAPKPKPATPAPANNATQSQIQKECIDQFNDSSGGKVVNFMSMASPVIGPDRLGSTIEDVGGTTLKFGVYTFFNTISKTWAPTPFGSLSGVVAGTIETVAKDVVLPVSVGSTGLQIIAHAGCDTVWHVRRLGR
ncbi:MAG: repeat-associated core domain protein [Candidatus Angelobacter sp.]|nr:repeat-associated core domain protein [Candidatus Angelobacter sp.]